MADEDKKDVDTEPLLEHHRGKKDPTNFAKPVRAYWWRWVVLGVFSLNLGMHNVQWITFGPIADVIACYYGVSNFWVNSLAMMDMLVYVLFFVLSALSLERLGLRTTIVIGSCLNALGAALRVAGTGTPYHSFHALAPPPSLRIQPPLSSTLF